MKRRPRTGAGARTWSSRQSRTSTVRCGCESRVGKETRPSKIAAAPARFGDDPRGEHLAVRVHAHDPALRRYGVHDPYPMAIEQRVQLRPQRRRNRRSGSRRARRRRARRRSRTRRPVPRTRRRTAASTRGAAGLRGARRSRREGSRIESLDLLPESVHTAATVSKTVFGTMEERVTIRELARRSGVSVGTVSRALNGYADVRPETRERIMRLASELDYTPAAAARSLVTQRSHVIGVFLETGEGHPDLQHPFFHEVLGGLKQRVGAEGFDLLLFASERPGNGYGPHSYLKRARHHNVDGCALIGLDHRGGGGAAARARRDPLRRDRHGGRGPADRGRDVRQRGRRGRGGAPSSRARSPAHRDDHRNDRLAPGHRPAARLPCRDPGARPRLPRRLCRLRGFLRRVRARGDGPPARLARAADRRSSRRRT